MAIRAIAATSVPEVVKAENPLRKAVALWVSTTESYRRSSAGHRIAT
jgi:hypothetical protein